MNNEPWEEVEEDRREEEEEEMNNPPVQNERQSLETSIYEEEKAYWQDN